MKVIWLIKNVCKMGIWIAMIATMISEFGLWISVIASAILFPAWSLIVTLVRAYKSGGRDEVHDVLGAIFGTQPATPFTVYGCYCSPKYGVDGRTNGRAPIDGLDAACKTHDETMLAADRYFREGYLSIADHRATKNIGDLTFMYSAIVSDNGASGVYLLALEIGFLFRIISRSLFR